MKKLILLALAFAAPFVHAYHPDNLDEIYWYEGYDAQNVSYVIHVYTLAQSPATIVATPIQTREEFYNCRDTLKNIPCHNLTRADLVNILNLRKQTNEYQIITRFTQRTNSPLFTKDTNGNGIPEFRELIAGGEPLYWQEVGNGYQFYVNGQMLVCNSDTNWQNVPYSQVPESVTQQYPDENHNGIPDIVDSAIAAGGGAVSEGGNITVTVNTQQIQVQVDNQPVLNALNNVIAKLDSLGAGSGGGESGSGTSTGSAFHCDALELKPTIEIIQAQTLSNFQALHALLSSLGAQYGLQLGDGIMRLGDPNTEDTLIKVARDLRYLLEKMRDDLNDGSWLLDERIKVKVHVEELDSVLQGMQAIKAVNEEIQSNTDGVLKHLQEVQQPQLEVIKTNTLDTAGTLKEILKLLKSFTDSSVGDADEPDKESADEFVDEAQKGVDDYKKDFEEDDKATEDEAANLKDYHKDKQSHGERIRDKLCGLFGIDVKRLKPSHQENGHHEITWYNTKPIANLTGNSSVRGRMLTQSFELDPRRFLDAHETWNGEDSNIMRDAYRDNVIPAMDIARTFLLFLVAWYFLGAMFDLVKDTWSL